MDKPPTTDAMSVFDRRLLRQRRNRAADGLSAHDFLLREAAERLTERLDDIKRRFPDALDLGCHRGQLAAALGARGAIDRLVQCDLSPAMAAGTTGIRLAADEETLPFAENSFDLILSCLSLHWVNDLPGALLQARRALKPDGLFLGAILGGETLKELRQALLEAELAEEGGVSPRVSPFADVPDAGGLLQRAGFALPVVDSDTVTVTYADALALMRDLRGMGETSTLHERRRGFTRRGTLFAAAARYQELFADADGRVPATFQIVYLTGWAPHETQPKALRPGSAEARLAEALDTTEHAAGAKADPEEEI